jgi:hypothetical protein
MSLALSRPIALALILAGAAVPAGLVAPMAGASGCPSETSTTQHITRSSPLSGRATAAEFVHRVTHEQETADALTFYVNGVDAYVYELSCLTDAREFKYGLEDRTSEELGGADYALAFYDDAFRKTSDTVYEKQRTSAPGQLAGWVPANTHYVVVILEEGPLYAGIDEDGSPAQPYGATFHLSLANN